MLNLDGPGHLCLNESWKLLTKLICTHIWNYVLEMYIAFFVENKTNYHNLFSLVFFFFYFSVTNATYYNTIFLLYIIIRIFYQLKYLLTIWIVIVQFLFKENEQTFVELLGSAVLWQYFNSRE